jgi:hypothetical protein
MEAVSGARRDHMAEPQELNLVKTISIVRRDAVDKKRSDLSLLDNLSR